jgi:mRNA-degrading endonuclease HigB of HigAB toxin-antitoxin module
LESVISEIPFTIKGKSYKLISLIIFPSHTLVRFM